MTRAEAIKKIEYGLEMETTPSTPFGQLTAVRTDALKVALSALKEQEKVATATCKWISVKERLPEVGKEVLICDARDAFLGMFFLKERKSDKVYCWFDRDGWGLPSDEVTHWMPLPKPPKEE